MDLPSRSAPKHVPVLTEVIDAEDLVPSAEPSALVADTAPRAPVTTTTQAAPSLYSQSMPLRDMPALRASVVAPVLNVMDEAQLAQRVLSEVQRQIDSMLEYRLREAMTPILARVSDALVRELRQELSRTMSDVVTRSVAQEVARQRARN